MTPSVSNRNPISYKMVVSQRTPVGEAAETAGTFHIAAQTEGEYLAVKGLT